MPFDPNGNYFLPPGYLAVTGQTILASQHNPPLEDIQGALNQALLRSGVAPWTGNQNANGQRLRNLGTPSDPNDAVTLSYLSNFFPSGIVIDFAGGSAPSGWLLCAGQAVSRSTFAALFGVLGTRYGAGDGSSTFNLPDLRGRVVAGRDDMNGTAANRLTSAGSGISGVTLGGNGGAQTQTLSVAQMPFHNHGGETTGGHGPDAVITNIVRNGFGNFSFSTSGAAGFSNGTVAFNGHTHSIPSQGGNAPHNNTQPTFILNKIIKV